MSATPSIGLVVFDWAGTTIDFGCFAPLTPFIGAFARAGVTVTPAQARRPMGLHKKDHLRELLRISEVGEQWRRIHNRAWNEDDIAALFEHFAPLQMAAIEDHSRLIPGLLECVHALRDRGVFVATTTGYFGAAAQTVYVKARQQGYEPDYNLCADDVPTGRPAPWMMFRHMESCGVYPARRVIKVGDTIPDMEEGRNAGAWCVGVSKTGSEVGLTEAEFSALTEAEQTERLQRARKVLEEAGAHHVIESVADLPALLPVIEAQLREGQRP